MSESQTWQASKRQERVLGRSNTQEQIQSKRLSKSKRSALEGAVLLEIEQNAVSRVIAMKIVSYRDLPIAITEDAVGHRSTSVELSTGPCKCCRRSHHHGSFDLQRNAIALRALTDWHSMGGNK